MRTWGSSIFVGAYCIFNIVFGYQSIKSVKGVRHVIRDPLGEIDPPSIEQTSTNEDGISVLNTDNQTSSKRHSRIFVLGDLHGDLEATLKLLKEAQLIRMKGSVDNVAATLRSYMLFRGAVEWSGENAILVQLGDVVDRGPDGYAILMLFKFLGEEARMEGGKIIHLYGNHELLNLCGIASYVNPIEIDRYYNGSLENWEHCWSKEGDLGKWMRKEFLVYTTLNNRYVFVHGGLTPFFAKMSPELLKNKILTSLNHPSCSPAARHSILPGVYWTPSAIRRPVMRSDPPSPVRIAAGYHPQDRSTMKAVQDVAARHLLSTPTSGDSMPITWSFTMEEEERPTIIKSALGGAESDVVEWSTPSASTHIGALGKGNPTDSAATDSNKNVRGRSSRTTADHEMSFLQQKSDKRHIQYSDLQNRRKKFSALRAVAPDNIIWDTQGPFWLRSFSKWEEKLVCKDIQHAVQLALSQTTHDTSAQSIRKESTCERSLGPTFMFVGHTVTHSGHIEFRCSPDESFNPSRCDSMSRPAWYIMVDTGISRFVRGTGNILKIEETDENITFYEISSNERTAIRMDIPLS